MNFDHRKAVALFSMKTFPNHPCPNISALPTAFLPRFPLALSLYNNYS